MSVFQDRPARAPEPIRRESGDSGPCHNSAMPILIVPNGRWSEDEQAAFDAMHEASARMEAAAAAKDRPALLGTCRTLLECERAVTRAVHASRLAENPTKYTSMPDVLWRIEPNEEIACELLVGDPVAFASRVRAELRNDSSEDESYLLAPLPEERWELFQLRSLMTLRVIDGDWRPIKDFANRAPGWFRRDFPHVGHLNSVIAAFAVRDGVAARDAIDKFARAIPRPDTKAFLLMAYAFFQDARNLGIEVRVPRTYDFLGEPDLARARTETQAAAPVVLEHLSVRSWLLAAMGLDDVALGPTKIETDPGIVLSYPVIGDKWKRSVQVRIVPLPDVDGRVGRSWRLSANDMGSYHVLEVTTDDLRLS